LELVRSLVSKNSEAIENPLRFEFSIRGKTCIFDGIFHFLDNLLVIEFEPCEDNSSHDFTSFYKNISKNFPIISSGTDLQNLLQKTVDTVRDLTGFDRVMLYQFRPDEHGTVTAESKTPQAYSYLGQTFPDSDIPQQARALYKLNWLRLILDANYKPSVIFPGRELPDNTPLDLSHSALRSVSPVHLEYLRNMRVAASMSISIVVGDRLWGLIACHHMVPHFVPYEIRTAMEFLGKHTSSLLEAYETTQKLENRIEVDQTYQFYLRKLIEEPESSLSQLLSKTAPKYLNLTHAVSGAITSKDDYLLLGEPKISKDQLFELRTLLSRFSSTDVFVTEKLTSFFPRATEFSQSISGMISGCLSREHDIYFFWFRPEEIETLHWAGRPTKLEIPEFHSGVIHPRKSFETWKEVIKCHSSIWEETEIIAASNFLKLFRPQTKIF
jgi:chemotaxis family two-component system sensor kinase Cph1